MLFSQGNPYNEIIDYEDMNSLHGKNQAETGDNKTKRPALVVQQLPPPMMLPT